MNNTKTCIRVVSNKSLLFAGVLLLALTTLVLLSTGTSFAYPGELDTSFNAGGSGFDNNTYSTALQKDGKILVAGNFSNFNGSPQNRLIRLNSDGSKDSSFDIGTGPSHSISTIVVQPDDKILIGGSFTSYDGYGHKSLTRLNSDGSRDTNFDIAAGFTGQIISIVLQQDSKIIVGGLFGSFNGSSQNRLIRLNPDGSKDTSFDVGAGFNSGVRFVTLLSDNKILVGGNYTAYNNLSQNRLIRLNPDGSKDASFDIGTGFNSGVSFVTIQTDNKLIIVGDYTIFNTQSKNRVLRLNSDGSLDETFDIGVGFDSYAYTTTDLGNSIFVAGMFITFNGQSANRLARIYITDDKDQDGITDTAEDTTPNNGDANNDGVKDSLQSNVTSFTNTLTNEPVTLETDSQCRITSAVSKTESSLAKQDNNYSYPLGLLDFTTNCGTPGYTTTVKIYHYNAQVAPYVARKYNPNTNTYYSLASNTITTTIIGSSPVTVDAYNVKDGSSDDADGIANGIIVDPIGLALLGVSAPDTGIDDHNKRGLLLLALATIAGALLMAKTAQRKHYYRSRL